MQQIDQKQVVGVLNRRTSVTFPSDLYRTLEQIAEQQKLSVAWVIRDAAEKYVSERWPLLERKE